MNKNDINNPIIVNIECSQDTQTILSKGDTWFINSTCEDGIKRGSYYREGQLPRSIRAAIIQQRDYREHNKATTEKI